MSLAELFGLKETWRQRLRQGRILNRTNRRSELAIHESPAAATFSVSKGNIRRFVFEALEPRLLLNAEPVMEHLVQASAPIENAGVDPQVLASDSASLTETSHRNELVFIDSQVFDAEHLIGGVSPGCDIVLLDGDRDGIAQITEALAQRRDLDAVHFISHGSERLIKLGATWLTQESLGGFTEAIQGWSLALGEDADLLFYACDLGSGAEGRSILTSIQTLTGADVAASTNDTGHAQHGADWKLEFQLGAIQAEAALDLPTQDSWGGLLATFTVVTSVGVMGPGSLHEAILSANAVPGVDTIRFSIEGGGPQTINLLSALPTITEAVIIDGSTQSGFSGTPLIELNGALAGANVSGLVITAGGSTVKGLIINRFTAHGLVLSTGDSNVVEGNYIGIDATGELDLGNTLDGISIQSSNNNTIGGDAAAERNIISGNNSDGVELSGGSTGNTITGNYIGTNKSSTVDLGNSIAGIRIASSNANTIGGATSGLGNVISGNNNFGVQLDASSGITIQGNYIGTDVAGTADVGNAFDAIRIQRSSNNVIGGLSAEARNILSGNGQAGVYIENAGAPSTGNLVRGNYIGVDSSGLVALPNLWGIVINGADSNTIGGTSAEARNVISGNTSDGVMVNSATGEGGADSNVFQGNYIGVDAAGTGALGNGGFGLLVANSLNNVIGGNVAGTGNVISGTTGSGVGLLISGAPGTQVQGNYIGTNASGSAALPNADDGIRVVSSPDVTIGGLVASASNIISGNGGDGIDLQGAFTTGTIIQNNAIGRTGAGPLGNAGAGVRLFNSPNNTIGGTASGAGNTIAFNGDDGVFVGSSVFGNAIQGNNIYGNAGLGIDLGTNGVDVNDFGDADSGANNLQNFPVLTSARTSTGVITGSLRSSADTQFTIEFFSNIPADPTGFGEGQTFLGRTTVLTNGAGDAVFSVSPGIFTAGQFITATATDPDGNTSEFSQAIEAVPITVTTTTDSGPGSLRQAILDANLTPELDEIWFRIDEQPGPGGFFTITPLTALPNITAPVIIDGYTQPGAAANTLSVGNNAAIKIELNGSNVITNSGLFITAGNTTVRGLAINRFGHHGITLDSGDNNVIEGNFLGTDPTGALFSFGNKLDGVFIWNGSSNNTIGGTTPATRNVISGNDSMGVGILQNNATPVTGNVIAGNYIGMAAGGTAFVPNMQYGISIGAPGNTIGGAVSGAGNLISGNTKAGILINAGPLVFNGEAGNNVVQGNLIGTDAFGTLGVGNGEDGILISSANNVIGGSVAGARNIIAWNGGAGVFFTETASGNSVKGNFIGTDFTGLSPLGNGGEGVGIAGGSGNIIGGVTAADRNVIADNAAWGVTVAGAAHLIRGNYIGVGADGSIALGNNLGGIGVYSDGTSGATSNIQVGGTDLGAGNRISFNNGPGVLVGSFPDGTAPTGISIHGNEIFSNAGLGIDLGFSVVSDVVIPSGVTANDLHDADSGPNNFQNFPILATAATGSSTITGSLLSQPNQFYLVEFFSSPAVDPSGQGEGRRFLGVGAVQTNAAGTGDITFFSPESFAAGDVITATVTDLLGNTSEFSPGLVATADASAPYEKISEWWSLEFAGTLDPGDAFGKRSTVIGDLDNDGVNDLAVGAWLDDDGGAENSGSVWILFLNSDQTIKARQKISTEGSFTGALSAGDRFGTEVTAVGDLDLDGVEDLAVGALGDTSGMGAVWILFLNTDGTVKTYQKINATEGGFSGQLDPNDFFGASIAPVGDLNNDGIPDLAVGAHGDDDGGTDRGALWILFMNRDGTVKSTPSPVKISQNSGGFGGTLNDRGNFGWSAVSLGDLDGDGVSDLAIGATFSADELLEGSVWIVRLNANGTVKAQQQIGDGVGGFTGTLDPGDRFGISVANMGDLDGDTVVDLAIGASGDDDGGSAAGAVYMAFLNIDGTVKGFSKISATDASFGGQIEAGDRFGPGLVNLGDVNGDSITDLGVGAVTDDDGGPPGLGDQGAMWLLYLNSDGSVKSTPAPKKISALTTGFVDTLDDMDHFGRSVANIGDLDNDGVIDIAVGAWMDDDGGTDQGAIWVFFMNGNGTVKSRQKISETIGGFAGVLDPSDQFGVSITSLGDLDGDTVEDLAVGALFDDDGGTNRGAVWTLFMNSNGTVKTTQKISATAGGFTSALADNDNFGVSLAKLGDLDGDGITELAVGAAGSDDGGTDRGSVWVLFLNSDGTVKNAPSPAKISQTSGGFGGTLVNGDRLGFSLAPLGDLNGDGVQDLAAGASFIFEETLKGSVWVLFLDTDGAVIGQQQITEGAGGFVGLLDPGDRFGVSLANVGDLNHDGFTDLVVGASGDDDGSLLPSADARGAAYVLLLNTGGTVKAQKKLSDTAGTFPGFLSDNDRFGISVAGLGDLNSDGITDLAVGALLDDDGGNFPNGDRGALWILFDELGSTFTVNDPGDAGDANPGDGLALTSTGVTTLRAAIEEANALPGRDRIEFNLGVGTRTTITLGSVLAPIVDAVIIDGTTDPDYAGAPVIELSGNGLFGSGLELRAAHSVIRGLMINKFATGIFVNNSPGTSLAQDNVIELNYIGTDASGTSGLGNFQFGIQIEHSPNNTVLNNWIAANGIGIGLAYEETTSNVIKGNTIGIAPDGDPLGNENDGIWIVLGASNNVIGDSSQGNVISANQLNGVYLANNSEGNLIQGNTIGLDLGNNMRANGGSGIFIDGSNNNVIGGSIAGARNIISGNAEYGIFIAGVGNRIIGNTVGAASDETTARGNGWAGISIEVPSQHNIVGGSLPGEGNVIVANGTNGGADGVFIFGSNNMVQGNFIGTNRTGTALLGNQGAGIYIWSGANNRIGGTNTGAGNIIANNASSGVFVRDGDQNSILGNAIHTNAGLGIDLAPFAVTGANIPQDTLDADSGPNSLQNFPALTSVHSGRGGTTISGTLSSTPNSTFTIELFSNALQDSSGFGEGQGILGRTVVTTGITGTGTFTVNFPVQLPIGQVVTATATDASGNTSEFSAGVSVTNAGVVSYPLNVTSNGKGAGVVKSQGTGIDSSLSTPDLTELYPSGSLITLEATPTTGTLLGWTDNGVFTPAPQTGPFTHTVSMLGAHNVTATFSLTETTPPSAPKAPEGTSLWTNSVTFTWYPARPPIGSNQGLAGYNVAVGYAPGEYGETYFVPASMTTLTLFDRPAVPHYFTVTTLLLPATGGQSVLVSDSSLGADSSIEASAASGVADGYAVAPNTPFSTTAATGVLANDTGAAQALRPSGQGLLDPTRGALLFKSDGSFTYTPFSSFTSGTDTFEYLISDGITTNLEPVRVTLTLAEPSAASVEGTVTPQSGLAGWALLDDGDRNGPSNWSGAQSPVLSQLSSIGSSEPVEGLLQRGTVLYLKDGLPQQRTDYRLTFTLESADSGALGVLFRYTPDPSNPTQGHSYSGYRFSMDQSAGVMRLIKIVGGLATVVQLDANQGPAETRVPYITGARYTLTLTAIGSRLVIDLQASDGTPVTHWEVTDAVSPLTGTGLALYSSRNPGGKYNLLGAEFMGEPTTAAVEVLLTGTGAGTVISTPDGIVLPGSPAASYPVGQRLTLIPAPASTSYTFSGWTALLPDGVSFDPATGELSNLQPGVSTITASFGGLPPPAYSLDVNADGEATPEDAIVILRYLSLVTGPALTAGVVTGGQRAQHDQIKTYLDGARSTMLDVNLDGQSTPEDAIVILRHLSLVSGPALTAGVVTGGNRTDHKDIKDFLNRYMPVGDITLRIATPSAEEPSSVAVLSVTADTGDAFSTFDDSASTDWGMELLNEQDPPWASGLTTTASLQPLTLPSAKSERDSMAGDGTSYGDWAASLVGLDEFRLDRRFIDVDGRRVATVILDTGADLDHPFFGSDTDGNGIADRIVYQYDFANNDSDASDRNGHGSNIAGIIGSQDMVDEGIAPGTDLIILKVFRDNGSGTFGDVERALQWVVAHADDYKIGVVNMSLGDGRTWTDAVSLYGVDDELAALAAKNVLLVAAAGNHYFDNGSSLGVAYPAADPAVLAVGAVWSGDFGGPWRFSSGAVDLTTGADRIASFSQRDDNTLDVLAPGARLTGAGLNGGRLTLQGTSQASAYLAGVAALAQDLALKEVGRLLTPQEFTTLVRRTADVVIDGDNEQDNVLNTGLRFPRVDVEDLAEGILRLKGVLVRSEHRWQHGISKQEPPLGAKPTLAGPLFGSWEETEDRAVTEVAHGVDGQPFHQAIAAQQAWLKHFVGGECSTDDDLLVSL